MIFIDKKNVEVQKVTIIKRENLFVKKIVTKCEPSLSTQTISHCMSIMLLMLDAPGNFKEVS